MKFVSDLTELGVNPPSRDSLVLVLSGNGRRERLLLKGFSQRHDGKNKIIFYPENPGPVRKTGPSALEAVKLYVDKVQQFLFISDIEHFNGVQSIKDQVLKYLYGVTIHKIDLNKRTGEDALLIKAELGSHPFIIHSAIFGEKKCVEENLAYLIRLELSESVPPEKYAIDHLLHDRHIHIDELINSSRRKSLATAFGSLYTVFRNIEKNVAGQSNC